MVVPRGFAEETTCASLFKIFQQPCKPGINYAESLGRGGLQQFPSEKPKAALIFRASAEGKVFSLHLYRQDSGLLSLSSTGQFYF